MMRYEIVIYFGDGTNTKTYAKNLKEARLYAKQWRSQIHCWQRVTTWPDTWKHVFGWHMTINKL